MAIVLMLLAGVEARSPAWWLDAARAEPVDSPERSDCLALWTSAPGASGAGDPEGADAGRLAEVAREGGARLYGTHGQGRLHVTWIDPLGVIGRVEAWGIDAEGRRFALPLLAADAAGRATHRLPAAFSGRVELLARAARCRVGEVVVRTLLDLTSTPQSGLPGVPTLDRPPSVPEPEPEPPAPSSELPWWWLVGLGLAVAGVGLAVWEEAR